MEPPKRTYTSLERELLQKEALITQQHHEIQALTKKLNNSTEAKATTGGTKPPANAVNHGKPTNPPPKTTVPSHAPKSQPTETTVPLQSQPTSTATQNATNQNTMSAKK